VVLSVRLRVVIPVVVVIAAVLGLLVGARLPESSSPAQAGSTGPGSETTPGASPSDSDGTGVTTPVATTRNIENYPITRLKPGEKPPQFVIVSFDGSCKHELFQHYYDLGQQTNSRFTFFLSGLCLVPDQMRFQYHPPLKPVGSSAIGFADPTLVNGRVQDWSLAYTSGYEIGTHWLGHFCDSRGVAAWTSANWQSELDQARRFLDQWAEVNAGNPSANLSLKLSFDSSVWHGDRTPCLAGRRSQMYPVFAKAGFTYDASNGGSLEWPRHIPGYQMWNFPLQTIKIIDWPGNRHNLSMDYNLLYVQNNGDVKAAPAKCATMQASAYASYMAALKAVYNGNRAPFFVGNHFEQWACGAYANALSEFIVNAHQQFPGVEFVSNEYLVKWLAAQTPAVIAELQATGVQKQ
jgi:hypothetical protein